MKILGLKVSRILLDIFNTARIAYRSQFDRDWDDSESLYDFSEWIFKYDPISYNSRKNVFI